MIAKAINKATNCIFQSQVYFNEEDKEIVTSDLIASAESSGIEVDIFYIKEPETLISY